jgi:hypothetical protein
MLHHMYTLALRTLRYALTPLTTCAAFNLLIPPAGRTSSTATWLSSKLPASAVVVKAFNNLSAYTLLHGDPLTEHMKSVAASNDRAAAAAVADFGRALGLEVRCLQVAPAAAAAAAAADNGTACYNFVKLLHHPYVCCLSFWVPLAEE